MTTPVTEAVDSVSNIERKDVPTSVPPTYNKETEQSGDDSASETLIDMVVWQRWLEIERRRNSVRATCGWGGAVLG